MKIYYSRSNDVDDSKINPQIELLIKQLGVTSTVQLTKYKRGSKYSDKDLKEADLVVVGANKQLVFGKGCYDELIQAISSFKPVLLMIEEGKNAYILELKTFLYDGHQMIEPIAKSDSWITYAKISSHTTKSQYVFFEVGNKDLTDYDFFEELSKKTPVFSKFLSSNLVWVDSHQQEKEIDSELSDQLYPIWILLGRL